MYLVELYHTGTVCVLSCVSFTRKKENGSSWAGECRRVRGGASSDQRTHEPFAPQASIAAVADGPTSLASALDAAPFAPAGSALAKTVPGATTSDQVVFSADEAYAEGASPSPQAIIESSYTSAELPGTPNQRDRNVTGTRSGPGRSERSGTD